MSAMGRPSFVVIFSVAFLAVFLPELWQLWCHLEVQVYHRLQADEHSLADDHLTWYSVDKNSLSPKLRDKFIQLKEDDSTRIFLENCVNSTQKLHWQMLYKVAHLVLSFFMTKTSINGLLDKTSMFVFSEQQFNTLIDVSGTWQASKLLDLGAGNGGVTSRMTSHFNDIYATELSPTMVWRLKNRGFSVLPVDGWHNGSLNYDVISCLNLLDRCDDPLTMLNNIETVLLPDTGRLLVAMVLPLNQFVETGRAEEGHRPREKIPVRGKSFEQQASQLVTQVFEPAGFELVRFTKLPYLSEGNLQQSFYKLPDAVFVLKKPS